MHERNEIEPLMTAPEVARLFRVDPKTVARWAAAGKLGEVVRTPGGHRRFREDVVRRLLAGRGGES